MESNLFLIKSGVFSATALLCFIFWRVNKFYQGARLLNETIIQKCNNIEKLLVDIRDGTKNFYKEKRKSPRVRGDITAIIEKKKTKNLIKVIDVSYEGALLRTHNPFKVGQTIELGMRLPLYAQPIDVKAKVVRIAEAAYGSGEKPSDFDMGVEYLAINRFDKERLNETIDTLLKNQPYQEKPLSGF